MIISASRRTDIPAFYGKWFMNRLQAEEVLVRNPLNYRQVSRISLSPRSTEALVFWTKNPENFLPFLPEIEALGHRYYVLFTLTPYDTTLEPRIGNKEMVLETFRKLSRLIGPERVIWRYDPVILTDVYTFDYHVESFNRLSEKLSGFTKQCIISFLDDYRKVRRNMQEIRYLLPKNQLMEALTSRFADAGKKQGMTISTCCEKIDLQHLGIQNSRCIDHELIGRLTGRPYSGIRKNKSRRNGCGCAESRDIGSYNTCLYGCLYCYAVSGHTGAASNVQRYDPSSPMLCDSLRGDETIVSPVTQRKKRMNVSDSGLSENDLFAQHQQNLSA
ncbi:DUF1848 domain-containing protein [Chlorobium phaeobacteroides]|jgi:hypothetical protein|uniref:DUF1848 domain-containing protein n=1 Tax=Chlorobium phaeobacteroides (strain DSM 266 / SMG 266 / 2430) TaxID=290317 RepID=A1BF92_CHLPD|nr:DUF1848 domain-containing protein [Chlorobium phaeobacteroides]ABL65069.1 conserved hypothetical protein [Chlorobium phaeobacteroides DSM 266]MBV5326978.1 DUF1848 domain-containing protein [Chlorobium sp.]